MLAFHLLNAIKWSLDDPEDMNWMHMLIFSPFKYSSSPANALKEKRGDLELPPSLEIAPWNQQQKKKKYLYGTPQF